MKLKVDSSMCQGHGLCYARAPQLFDCDDEGYAVLLVDEPPADLVELARITERACPEGAISLD